ncbi:MAG: glycosyltransferase [Rhodoferax sp.]|nr:glycosyltransferase [Rhodoferax sp.]NCP54660.1 glycosyltransferase [Rhodoferax sp.]PIW07901.1 MAG: HAD family hydrolase [Comamonadaceae bacterium CG17_big_fil_post_rev_8_21_14_2_50_60_13]PIY27419.1 MAG: HAD family hydrolase [Comamonadaceae bacterium CG_4_10_14_3_um_filter_60_75]PJC13921.1 MAG: HAD family hydrolase [Comamonadaceae bacterium CG_4_9_14_0_8_um_filter_60_18]
MKKQVTVAKKPLFIVLISVHGLIRGHDLELGRDADTGGQTKYVVELARALGEHQDVEKVVLLTRRVIDPLISVDYAQVLEPLSNKAGIVRIECGEEKYLRKEMLWDSLENFSDNVLTFLQSQPRLPDVIHSHYADAGYVGSLLSHQLGIPLVHTGHSLGRNKRQQLLASGIKRSEIESTYHISRRIEAEETTLGSAERVITSTQQEIEQQYGLYDFYQPERMRVVPPGTDLAQFFPPLGDEKKSPIAMVLKRYLSEPNKPMILALSRPDPKKNLVALIEAYGECPALQDAANLVIVAGNRYDITEMGDVAKAVLTDILLAIDKYDLYGKVAYPKHHQQGEVAELYRLAAASHGVFANPALTEPFGLTLIEAAACGLPIVATEDGGPIDIIRNCQNGHLINPLDKAAMAATLLQTLSDRTAWRRLASNGIAGVRHFYSWSAHVASYLVVLQPLVEKTEPIARMVLKRRAGVFREQALFASLDQNLIGDTAALVPFLQTMHAHRKAIIFGIATGRSLDDALSTLKRNNIPQPDVLITGQGTQIHYAPNLTEDTTWARHIDHLWNRQAVRDCLKDVPGLTLQPRGNQSVFKLSYFVDPAVTHVNEIRQLLLRNEQAVNVIFSFGQFLDVLPLRASKGLALRWCAGQFGFPLEKTLVAGVTGADADMLRGNTLGVVVDNRHLDELADLANIEKIYFSKQPHAAGILEAMTHYNFFADARPESAA